MNRQLIVPHCWQSHLQTQTQMQTQAQMQKQVHMLLQAQMKSWKKFPH